jgi:hypothetical protein
MVTVATSNETRPQFRKQRAPIEGFDLARCVV